MSGDPRWHKLVKEVLKEIGESRGYDVSESEKEIILASRYRFREKKRNTHIFI